MKIDVRVSSDITTVPAQALITTISTVGEWGTTGRLIRDSAGDYFHKQIFPYQQRDGDIMYVPNTDCEYSLAYGGVMFVMDERVRAPRDVLMQALLKANNYFRVSSVSVPFFRLTEIASEIHPSGPEGRIATELAKAARAFRELWPQNSSLERITFVADNAKAAQLLKRRLRP